MVRPRASASAWVALLALVACKKGGERHADSGRGDVAELVDAQVPDAQVSDRDAQVAGGTADAGRGPAGLPTAAELCPRVIEKVVACSLDKKFLDGAFVFSKAFEKVKPIKVRAFHADVMRWRKGGKVRAQQCEAWQTNLYDGAGQMDDPGQLLKLLGAASLGCAALGKLLTDQGGLPQLVE